MLISPVDDQSPIVVAETVVKVQQGERVIITTLQLEAVDADTPEEKIILGVISQPAHGSLMLRSDSSDTWYRVKVSAITIVWGRTFFSRVNSSGENRVRLSTYRHALLFTYLLFMPRRLLTRICIY